MFDLGEERGTQFITMEFIPGQDLKGLIRQTGQLAVGTTINIAKQICDGLTEAHKLGVVHRDLKPSNIMIDKEGDVRIMDFGIARSLEVKGITGAGVMIGTPEYMSPEQVEGKEVDQRSDIYSLGVILYETVTGRVPFEGDTPFTVGVKHKSEMPKDPKELNSQIPEDLSQVILKCLEKEKEQRYQSAGEVRSELKNIENGIPTTKRIVPKRKPITSKEITVTFGLKKLFIPAVVITVLAIIAVVIWQPWSQKETVPIPSDKPSIAVLPFVDLSPQKDQEYFCDGMTDEIIAKLSRFKGWKVIPRTSMMRFKNTDKDIKEIGKELDVATLLEGSIGKESDDIRVNTKLIRIEDSISLWSDTYEKKLESVFAIQSDVAEKIANALQVELSPEEKERLEKKPTENLEAYNLYLRGRYFWNKRTEETMKKSVEYFEEALELDPNYALAYAGLADAYNMLGEYLFLPPLEAFNKAKEAALKSMEIDDTLAEAYVSIGLVKYRFDWDWSGAEKDFKKAIRFNASYATAHHWYGAFLRDMGRFDEALAEYIRALELDPISLPINTSLGRNFQVARQYNQAIEQCKKALEIDSNFPWAHCVLAQAYLQKSMFEEAISEFQKAANLSDWSVEYLSQLAHAYAVSGNRNKALKIIEELNSLEKAHKERNADLVELRVEPRFDSLRSDPRFKALLKKMGFE
jgi:serine/threonine protein kinase/DNA-binding SARP family transcriptional activator